MASMRLKFVSWSHNVIPQSLASQELISTSTKKMDPIPQKFLSTTNRTTQKSQSFHKPVSRGHTIKRSCSANSDEVFDEYSSEYIKELAQSFQLSEDEVVEEQHRKTSSTGTVLAQSLLTSEHKSSICHENESFLRSKLDYLEPLMLGISPEPPDWPEREEVLRARIERKASRLEIPLSLRMIKKKQQRREGFRDLGDLDCCAVQKAFSSMEFIIIELQSCALHMREVLCHEDLEGIIAKVQEEMHLSFVWLFQQVFSRTPALMINVMILLSNFSLYSVIGSMEPSVMGSLYESRVGNVSIEEKNLQSDFSFASSTGNSVDANRKSSRPSLSLEFPNLHEISEELGSVGEVKLWNSMVDEAKKVQVVGLGDDNPDHEEMQWFVSPVTVELEPDDYMDYFKTDLLYQMSLSQEPNNSLLLCNYAQFLHLVAHDYDRAEECFKRAIQVEPPDAESISQYANFLWTARKDLWGAEERFLQAMAAEPDNPYHASRYANFLWNSGGEETCYPLDTPQNNSTASNL